LEGSWGRVGTGIGADGCCEYGGAGVAGVIGDANMGGSDDWESPLTIA
jgi:hypothetical protein